VIALYATHPVEQLSRSELCATILLIDVSVSSYDYPRMVETDLPVIAEFTMLAPTAWQHLTQVVESRLLAFEQHPTYRPYLGDAATAIVAAPSLIGSIMSVPPTRRS